MLAGVGPPKPAEPPECRGDGPAQGGGFAPASRARLAGSPPSAAPTRQRQLAHWTSTAARATCRAGKLQIPETKHQTTPMASAPYIPATDAGFNSWFANFKTLINATPTNYGLVAGDATVINAQWVIWNAAYQLILVPATNTSPNVAAKDAARADALAVIRPYAQQIRNNGAVSILLKTGLGLTIPPDTLTPIPAPTSYPSPALRSSTPLRSVLQYQDSDAPSGKAKPYGSIGVEVAVTTGTAVAVDPTAAKPRQIVTKAPFAIAWEPSEVGKVATIWLRYLTRSGPGGVVQTGPWSPSVSFTVL